MTYTIKLDGGKYTVINDSGNLDFRRHGEIWEFSQERFQCGLVLAMAHRIEELETAIKKSLDGSLDPQGRCRADGMANYIGHPMAAAWHYDLRKVLEQKP